MGYPRSVRSLQRKRKGSGRLERVERRDRVVDRPAQAAGRADRADHEQVHSVARRVPTPSLQPQVGDEPDDPEVPSIPAADELGERSDLGGRAVVDHGPVEPREQGVGGAKALAVHAIDLVGRECGQRVEVLVRDERIECLRTESCGHTVEPVALGFGKERSGDVDPHHAETKTVRDIEPCSQTGVGGETGTTVAPPPDGATRSRYALRSQRLETGSPGPGMSGEKRAVNVAAPPGASGATTAASVPGRPPKAAFVGSLRPLRSSRVRPGIPLTKQACFELFVTRSR